MNRYAQSFRELIVYQKSRKVADSIFKLSKDFPKEELYSLTDQIRRSSRSIGAQIAEAWGKRRYIRHFLAKLTDADAEQLETQHWVDVCYSCKYLNDEQASNLLHDLEEIGRMLHSMMTKAEAFCSENSTDVHEEHDEYFRSLTDH